jgi:YD repeat-containing protein
MTPGNRVQDLTYTYDANGNITHLVDASFTKTAKKVDYTYDDLNRLIKASTTPDVASGAPHSGSNYTEAWTYDALGNILTDATSTGGVTATTTYTYAGNTGSSYADPDAATQIGNDALTYDKNGNTLTGFGLTNVFDWRDRLATTTARPASSIATMKIISSCGKMLAPTRRISPTRTSPRSSQALPPQPTCSSTVARSRPSLGRGWQFDMFDAELGERIDHRVR